MGQTAEIAKDLPAQPVVSKKWQTNGLGLLKAGMSAVVKTFNPFQLVFFFMIIVTAAGELMSRHFFWGWYVILLLVLLASLSKRSDTPSTQETPPDGVV